ncbi:5-carboxymethyl-2-hydroxymuconate Delta-isomerase [Saccharospirillum sp.]|uniref:5-carboxymethyl-2-hydroxymuconate Delta-isomerase n=1 Tax=Saccharospirillum sp. TaxID=2033801 RepID=UPI0034A07C4A
MPHFVIEYARIVEETVDVVDVMEGVFEAAVQSEVMQAEDVKVRAIAYDHYRLYENKGNFIHVTVCLLQGRTDQQKERVAIEVRNCLAHLLPEISSISIDVRDMNPVAYKKRLLVNEAD